MDAEQPGECDGRELGGEVHEGGVATGAAVDAQAREADLELGGGERMAGGSSGEDPWLVVGACDGGAAVRAVEELAGEFVQRCGQVEGDGAEEQLDPQWAVGDLAAGEAGDAGQGLSVEQHEQAGHAVLDGVAVVVEKAADQCPPLVVFDLGEGLVAGVLGNVQVVGVAASAGPEHEGAGVVVGAGPAGEPGVDVVLGAGRQALAVFSQPGDQLERGPDLVVHVVGLLGGDVVPLRLPAEPPQVMPAGETANDPAFGGVLNPAGFLAGPPFESGEAFVAGGQDAAGHQDLAEVVGGTAGQVPVEVGVVGWPGGVADLGEDCRGGGAPGQPLHE